MNVDEQHLAYLHTGMCEQRFDTRFLFVVFVLFVDRFGVRGTDETDEVTMGRLVAK